MNKGVRKHFFALILLGSASCYVQLFLLIKKTDFNYREVVVQPVKLPTVDNTIENVPEIKNVASTERLFDGNLAKNNPSPSIKSLVNNFTNTSTLARFVERFNSTMNERVRGNNGTSSEVYTKVVQNHSQKLNANLAVLKRKINLTKSEIVEESTRTVAPKCQRCCRHVQFWAINARELGFKRGIHQIQCPENVCDVQLTVDTSLDTMQDNEALILFHWVPLDWDKMHKHRPPGQKWVFYTLESPRHSGLIVPPQKYYNTTYDYIMSYRYDSDFRADYGQYIAGRPEVDAGDNRNWAENRTKLIAWMASNCKATSWLRMQFVQRLERYIPVDTYGKCGNLTCQRGSKECDNTLKQYKFFLALENSECTDYITEKFWIHSIGRGLVPVVYGPPRSDYEKVAPPDSFIHIQDFRTTRELAAYLQKVDRDDALYNRYFDWKKKGSLKPYGGPSIMCQLGDRLVADERALQDGTYVPSKQKDWKTWWSKSCRPGAIPQ